jgi:hypothetical protein
MELRPMRAVVLLLAFVAPAPVVAQGAEGYAPADPPLPLGTTHPEMGGPYFFGDGLLGPGYSVGGGWKFADGSALELASNRGPVYCRPIYDTECYRCSVFAGTHFGARQEYYLGHGFAAWSELGTGATNAGILWYPSEYFSVSFGFDLLRGRFGWGWGLIL